MRLGFRFILFFFVGFLLCEGTREAFAGRDVALFDCAGKRLVADYQGNLASLRSGDRVALCEPTGGVRIVTIGRELGGGDRAVVFSIREDAEAALRLPRYPGEAKFITQTIRGARRLRRMGTAHVEIRAGMEGMWVMVERLADGDFVRYGQFSDFRESRSILAHRLRLLRKFALRNALYLKIGDFSPDNFVFSLSRDEWLVMDWDLSHRVWDFRRVPPAAVRREQPFIYLAQDAPELMAAMEAIQAEVLEYREKFFLAVQANGRLRYPDWYARQASEECGNLSVKKL